MYIYYKNEHYLVIYLTSNKVQSRKQHTFSMFEDANNVMSFSIPDSNHAVLVARNQQHSIRTKC